MRYRYYRSLQCHVYPNNRLRQKQSAIRRLPQTSSTENAAGNRYTSQRARPGDGTISGAARKTGTRIARVKGGRQPGEATPLRRKALGCSRMAVSAAVGRLQPYRQAAFVAVFARICTAANRRRRSIEYCNRSYWKTRGSIVAPRMKAR